MQAAQDRESFGSQIAKHIPALRGMAKLLARNAETAEDLTQDTLAKAWQSRGSFAQGTNLKAWLFAIMRNHFRSEMRRAWRRTAWDQESAERIPAPAGEQLWAVELEDTFRAIGVLSRGQRQALILAGVGGLSSEDAGAIIRCTPTAVKSRVARARHAIHAMLEGKEPLNRARSKGARRNAADQLVHQLQDLTAQASIRKSNTPSLRIG